MSECVWCVCVHMCVWVSIFVGIIELTSVCFDNYRCFRYCCPVHKARIRNSKEAVPIKEPANVTVE